jgi:hypothetical protein
VTVTRAGLAALILIVAATTLVSSAGCSKRQGWYRCHYRATIRTTDGRRDVPCVARALQAEEPNAGQVLIETKTTTDSPHHGWLRVVRPDEPGVIKVHLVVSCVGYADQARDFAWHITPDTCKPGVEVGEFRLEPGVPTAWPGTGPSTDQEIIEP